MEIRLYGCGRKRSAQPRTVLTGAEGCAGSAETRVVL
jgi:hypothetical protein